MSVNCRQTLSTKAFHPKKLKAGFAIMIGAGLDRDNFTDLRGAFNKFPDFFGMDTFINRTHKKL